MPKIDPEQERRRLSDFYAGQLDGELEKVAAQAYELTEVAKETLRAELAKRALTPTFVQQAPQILDALVAPQLGDPPPREAPAQDIPSDNGEFEFRRMVTLRQFRDLPEALLAKGCLDSAGIECALIGDNLVRLDCSGRMPWEESS